jgi:hypothetical protein
VRVFRDTETYRSGGAMVLAEISRRKAHRQAAGAVGWLLLLCP